MRFAVDEQEAEEIRRTTSRGRGTREPNDTEITLGTRSIVGIFFGLVLICGVFFGLGYSIGRGSAHVASLPEGNSTPALPGSPIAKPSADQSVGSNASVAPAVTPQPVASDTSVANPPMQTVVVPAGTASPAVAATSTPAAAPALKPAVEMVSTAPSPAPAGAAYPAIQPKAIAAASSRVVSTTSMPATSPMGTYMVQIAAVRVERDAAVLVSALKKHGYQPLIRHTPQDALLHIQVGPFATRQQAVEMRSKLLADGYNAVIK